VGPIIFLDDGSRTNFQNVVFLTKHEVMKNVQHRLVLSMTMDLWVPYKEDIF
jgi:hypothetical protein